MDDTFTIRVKIADRYYPLKIKRSDETKIRIAAKKINDTVFQYQNVYLDKDAQDFLAMAAIQFVTQLTEQQGLGGGDQYVEEIQRMCQQVDLALEKQ